MRTFLIALIAVMFVAAPIASAEEPVDSLHGTIAYLAPTEEAPEDAEGAGVIVYAPGLDEILVLFGVSGLEPDGKYSLRLAVRDEGEDTQIQELGSLSVEDGEGSFYGSFEDLDEFNVVQVVKDDVVYLTSWEGQGGWLKDFKVDLPND